MSGKRRNTDRRRIAAMAVAVFLVIILLLGTIAPFLARAESLSSPKACNVNAAYLGFALQGE